MVTQFTWRKKQGEEEKEVLWYLLLDLYCWLSVSLCYTRSRWADGRRAYEIESVASRPDQSANKGFWPSLNIITWCQKWLLLAEGVWITVRIATQTPTKQCFPDDFSFLWEVPSWIQKKTNMAIYQILAAEHMNCDGDISTNWKTFREAYNDYLIGTGLDQKDKKIQIATLKSLMESACNYPQRIWKIRKSF